MTNNKKYTYLVSAILVLFLFIVLFIWLLHDPVKDFTLSLPGMDGKNKKGAANTEKIKIGEKFLRFADIESGLIGKWPQFRGLNHDNVIFSEIKINENWKSKEPKLLWSDSLGEGHAAPAIYDGFVYVLDYDEKLRADMLRCFSLETGKEIWRRWYHVHLKRNHGISRTIPAVSENYIVTIGPRCQVMCVERKTGNFLWGIDLEKEYETETPLWYTGQCPLIENDVAVIAPGGKAMMVGIDCKTGKKLWETPNIRQWTMSHASVVPAVVNGKRMYIYAAVGGMCGISAEGDDIGKILWDYSAWSPAVVAPTPVILKNDMIFFTAGYGAGSALVKIETKENKFTAREICQYKPDEGIACEQQTPVFYDGYLYAVLPKDAGVLKNQFVCYAPEDCKKPVWTSGKTNRFGLGPWLFINNKFLILDDDGTLTLIQASKNKYIELSKKKFFEGQDSWGPMAFADGFLLLRDSKCLFCLDLR